MEETVSHACSTAETDSQDLIDRVPESPPLYTQDLDDDKNSEKQDKKDEDVEAEIAGCKVSPHETKANTNKISIISHNESPGQSLDAEGAQLRKTSDVVIDMEEEEEDKIEDFSDDDIADPKNLNAEEFAADDDLFLVSAVEGIEGAGTALEQGQVVDQMSQSVALSEGMKAEDAERRKVVDGFKKFAPLDKIFPDVRCSEHNTVAFHVRPNYRPGDVLEPNPPKCVHKWEPKFIRMPFCNENIACLRTRARTPPMGSDSDNEHKDNDMDAALNTSSKEKDVLPGTIQRIRLWSYIKDALKSEKILCSQDFVSVLKCYTRVNSELQALDYCIEQIMGPNERQHFFTQVVPFMTSLVLKTSQIITCPIPFLKKNLNHNISLSQKQVACLLANAFFSTFPQRFKCQMETPSINFKELFTENDENLIKLKAEKIRCIIHYFTRLEANMPEGVVTYSRKNLRHSNMPKWESLDKRLRKLVPLLQGTIEEDGSGMLKVDFANSNIGGGVLSRGAVQEEILFLIYPELIASRLFTEKLNFNEAVIVTGCERFSKYQGYASSFKFAGDYIDTTPHDARGRRCTQIVAIDALYINRPTFQYHPKHILREVNKAYVGFNSPVPGAVAIATGKWGCGAFNGDPQLKTIIQWLAASYAGRDVVLYTFEDIKSLNDILSITDSLKDMAIKDVWNLLHQYHSLCCASGKVTRTLKEFCQHYSDGNAWLLKQEAEKQARSSIKKLKEVTITTFYPSEKVKKTVSPDDVNVVEITSSMDKINSTPPPSATLSCGKRLREDEPDGLSEEEIKQQLLSETNIEENIVEPMKETITLTEEDTSTSSPQLSKRPRLPDFYPCEQTDTG